MVKNINKNIVEITLEQAKDWGHSQYITDGLALTDLFSGAHIPNQTIRMNFIVMALCQSGHAEYTIDTRQQIVNPGDLLFISERHVVDQFQATPDFKCQCLMVSNDYYHSFIQNVKNMSSLLLFSMNYPVVQLTSREQSVFNNYFEVISQKMSESHHHYRKELVKSLLLAMFYDMSNVIYRVERKGSRPQTRADVLFSKFIKLLDENYRMQHRVSWYAETMCITPKYLSQIVSQVSNRTPNEWIESYILLELRVLLRNSGKSIKEITDYMNFPNQSFLGKYFKERMGVGPKEYRKG